MVNKMSSKPVTCHYIHIGSQFAVWTGGYCCPGENVSVLVCVVTSGYHTKSSYQWYLDGQALLGDDAPVLYSELHGVFKCEIRFVSETKDYSFIVKGIGCFELVSQIKPA